MYTIIANQNIRNWLNKELRKYEIINTNKTIEVIYSNKRFKIIVYKTNTLLISGEISDRIYNKLIIISNEKNFIGSDEVGVGDFFGPTVYCAVKINKKQLEDLASSYISIKDSKKYEDKEILKIYKRLCKLVDYEIKVLYDKDIKELNSVEQKVVSHSEIINKLKVDDNNVVIDLFTTQNAFYKYSQTHNIKWTNKLILETKADNKYYTVAIASIIARGYFLEEINKLNQKYNFDFPLGSSNIDKKIKEFLNVYSKEELSKFCKTTFKTFKDL